MSLSNAANFSIMGITPDASCKVTTFSVRCSEPVSADLVNFGLKKTAVELLLQKASASSRFHVSSLVQNSQISVDGSWWNA